MLLDTSEYVAEFNAPGSALAIADDELRRAVRACGIEQSHAARAKYGDVPGFFVGMPKFGTAKDRDGI